MKGEWVKAAEAAAAALSCGGQYDFRLELKAVGQGRFVASVMNKAVICGVGSGGSWDAAARRCLESLVEFAPWALDGTAIAGAGSPEEIALRLAAAEEAP